MLLPSQGILSIPITTAATHLSTGHGTGEVKNTHTQTETELLAEDTMDKEQNFKLNMKVTVEASYT